MRTLLIAGTAMAAMFGAGPASAGERVVQRGPAGYGAPRPATPWVGQPQRAPRWGSKVGGRWWGGANAPGGWNAYRRPVRGWAVPVYWNSPRFYISDWSTYGLQQPQYGYNWVRYYDDAVLIDSRGSVYDTADNVDWDRYDSYANDDRGYAPDPYPQPRDNGLGGAAIGAVAGGVVGNRVAGRGNRVGGTLIGAGVGGAVGYAIDRNDDRRAPLPPRDDYGARYPQPGYAPPPPPYARPPAYPPHRYPPAPVAGGGHWVSPDGGTTVVTSGGGYGGSVTTITVQTAPVVTTTTTEIYEDHVTWSRPAAHKKVWKPRRKVTCYCK